jgi:hypothetical protein
MVFETKVLRRIFGPTKERDGTWIIKTNYELYELIRRENTVFDIKTYRLQRVCGSQIIVFLCRLVSTVSIYDSISYVMLSVTLTIGCLSVTRAADY